MAISIRGATLIDGTGADPVADATVTIENGVFSAIGEKAEGEILDLDELTLLPGLIDAHAHMGLVEINSAMKISAMELTALIFENCRLALNAGFTSLRDLGGVDGGLVRSIESGLVPGPRLFPSGPILCQSGGHGDLRPLFFDHELDHAIPGLVVTSVTCDGADEVRKAAREAFRSGATQIKLCVSGGVVSYSDRLEDTQFSVEELRAAVEEANARETYVTAHAHHFSGIRLGVEAGISCFEHASYLDEETAASLAAAGSAIVPTLAVLRLASEEGPGWGLPTEVLERSEGVEAASVESIQVARSAGVKIGSGSDIIGRAQNRRGLEVALKAAILGPMEAIVSATQTNATIMRMQDRIGTIERGRVADLIAVDFDPLEKPELFDDPERVVYVIKGGEIVKGDPAPRLESSATS